MLGVGERDVPGGGDEQRGADTIGHNVCTYRIPVQSLEKSYA